MKSYTCGGWYCDKEAYPKKDVDEAIAELKAEKEKLDDLAHAHNLELLQKENAISELKRALWLARAERYKMKEFIAREEGTLLDLMAWSQYLRERTYNQWVNQLLRIANLANKLQNKCRAKTEDYKQ